MSYSLWKKILVAGCSAALFGGSLNVNADYSAHPKAVAFAEKMATEHGFKQADVLQVLAQASKQQKILDAIARPAEKTKPWHEYRNIFLGQTRIDQGVEFWLKNEKTLARAAQVYNVDPQMIVAIIGVETRYGRYTGSYRVVDALATLGFDYEPRAKFFSKELEHVFLLAKEQKQDILSLKGSYAGAMGYGQFIPSSYRHYAIDFDGDGIADIWNNPVDAIGSVANYFAEHKWRSGEPVFARARVSADYKKDELNSRVRPHLTVAELKEQGFSPVDATIDDQQKAVPLVYDGENGKEFWLGFGNFYSITRYNRSQLYAMAAWQLSDEILHAYQTAKTPVLTEK